MFVIMKGGFRYSGRKISENEFKLILDDIKLGRIEILKEEIAVRGGEQ